MKKSLKIAVIICLNILIVLILFFLLEFIIYKVNSDYEKYNAGLPVKQDVPPFVYILKNISVCYCDELEGYFNGTDDKWQGRLPEGLQYKNAKPILLFGDSYMHGQYLKRTQNFGYKLANTLKRPVYIRAIPGTAMHHMYYQVSEPFAKTFFEQVPKSDDVFYLIIHDHYLRMSIFSDFDYIGRNFHLRYRIKNGKLIMDDFENPVLNFLKTSYIIRFLDLKFLDWSIGKPFFADFYTDRALVYFTETRRLLEEKWHNKINFNVIMYDNFPIAHKKLLKKKLEENGFNVVIISDITDIDLNSEEYLMQDNLHPTEAAWNVLTPVLIDKFKLQKAE